VRAGELRERITLQANTPTRDSTGAEVPHWADVATVWAHVVAVSGNESINQTVGVVAVAYQITIRDRDDLDPALRVIYAGQTLEIQAVLTSEETGGRLLLCRQVSREGAA